jgi:hypothetical protein
MNNVNKFIKEVLSIRGLKLECPHCEETFTPRRGKLFDVTDEPNKEIQSLYKSMRAHISHRREGVKVRTLEMKEEYSPSIYSLLKHFKDNTGSTHYCLDFELFYAES